ncbi:sister chromatid cohesion protein 1 [Dissophora globulifera]|uniref:Sister chromatid cohesion protein 1 n=1 Tax=Dissophora globulifera TaxID=979702 RepID=A0A9P6RR41_9FUNG|nr:sister chromatid cohesion protein 1 [Dissophora globulifera]
MFYSEAILSKKGPLAKVWLAAHWERKLTKNQLLQTNLHNSVDAIMGADQAPMALRLSGQLLLGVARIYSRKTKYLLEDCNEALVKIKVAFRSDAMSGDSNLLMLDANADLGPASRAAVAAFNAITVPDATTEFDLLLPAQNIDIGTWGLNPKLNHLSSHRDITLEDNNEDDLFSATGDYQSMDRGRRHLGFDIEVGRNHMNRIGGGGYSAMDFDLAGPDDALDLDMFGDDLLAGSDFDFLKRPHPHRRDDLEIEVGRDAVVSRRSASVDPLGLTGVADKQDVLRLDGSEDGRAPSVSGSTHDHPGFDDFVPIQDGARSPLHFDIVEGADDNEQRAEQHPTTVKKRKLVVDEETEMSQDFITGANADLVAEGLLTTHEMLPRSRKLLRLQQIEQDVAHGGLAGYLLDCTAGPRVTGSALVPELASLFSRRLQIAPEAPTRVVVEEAEGVTAMWQQDQVESWVDQIQDNNDFDNTTPPPTDTFEGFRLDSPTREAPASHDVDHSEGPSAVISKSSLFQELEDANMPAVSTKQLLGTVFSTSTIQTMRLVQHGLESRRNDNSESSTQSMPSRSTRMASVATASSTLNKDNGTRVTFSELMTRPNSSQKKQTRADAAKLFFELLVLSTKDVVKVEQEQSFGEITVGGSPWLETLVEADAGTTGQETATVVEPVA